MTVTKMHYQPGATAEGANDYHYDDDTGMEYAIYETIEGVFIGSCHDAVGLVSWWRADSYDEAMAWCAPGRI